MSVKKSESINHQLKWIYFQENARTEKASANMQNDFDFLYIWELSVKKVSQLITSLI